MLVSKRLPHFIYLSLKLEYSALVQVQEKVVLVEPASGYRVECATVECATAD